MKIVFILDNYHFNLGGASLSAKAMIGAYRRLGHDILVLTLGKKPESFIEKDGTSVEVFHLSSPWFNIKDSHLKTIHMNRLWSSICFDKLASIQPDVLFCQGMLTPATIDAAKKLKVPSRVFLHGYEGFSPHFFKNEDALTSDPICFKTAPFKFKIKWPLVEKNLKLYQEAYLKTDLLISNSQYMALLVKKYFQRSSKIVYPIWDIQERFGSHFSQPRQKPKSSVLLFIKPQKIKGIVRIKSLAALMPHAQFWIVGQPSQGIRRELAGRSNVRILDAKEDLGKIYQDADLLLGPVCFPEPYGRVFTEACFFGLPSVATKAGGIPESVGAGGVLMSWDASDEEWKQAILNALEEKNYHLLSEQALAFSRSLLEQQKREVLENLLTEERLV